MTNRREFIGHALAASLVAGLGAVLPVRASGAATARRPAPLYKAVFDSRFADGLLYARQAGRLGIATHAIAGDITDLWFNDLDLRWRRETVAVAGLTTDSALFCLEQLAWTYRQRVVFRAEHEMLASGCRQHVVSCPETPSPSPVVTGLAASDWAARLAHVHLAAASWQARRPTLARVESPPDEHGDGAGFLVSWVIARPVQG